MFDDCSLNFAVVEVLLELDSHTLLVEKAITIAVWCAVEAFLDEIIDSGTRVDVSFAFQDSEVLSIYEKKFDGGL